MLLPKIIGFFKMNSSKEINKIDHKEGRKFWQRNYYEHVIRDEKNMAEKREYITHNAAKWADDEYNPDKNQNC